MVLILNPISTNFFYILFFAFYIKLLPFEFRLITSLLNKKISHDFNEKCFLKWGGYGCAKIGGLSPRLKGGVSWKTKSTRLEKIATQIGKDMAAPR